MQPGQAATAVEGGAAVTHTESFRDLESRQAQFEQQYDNAGDKALALTDGLVSGLAGGLVDGIPTTSAYGELERTARGEFHPNYKTMGELAAAAATALAPESLLKYTPLGLANEAFTGVAGAADAALATRVGSKVLRKGLSEAAGGAVAAGALSSANAVEQSVQGKPVSGYALLDDIGLGAAIGLGFGVVGERLAQAAKKGSDIRAQIQAAARFDESALPVRGTLVDVSKSWDSAHNVAGARVDALDDLVKSGMLDAEMPGSEWLKARTDAKGAADSARVKLHKLAGTEDPVAIGERLHDMAVSGKAKEAQKLYQAFDEYGTAVSHLDDVMQPTTFDAAHLHDVIGDIDLRISADEHPMQRLEQMINNGSPPEEIEAFAKQIDENWHRESGHAGPNDVTRDLPHSNIKEQLNQIKAEQDIRGARLQEIQSRPLESYGPEELASVRDEVQRLQSENQAAREKMSSLAGDRPTGDVRGGRKVVGRDEVAGRPDSDFAPPEPGTPVRTGQKLGDFVHSDVLPGELHPLGAHVDRPGLHVEGDEALGTSTMLGGSRAGNEKAGFQAKKILDQARAERATGVMSPVRPTELGTQVQTLLDRLTAATGNRLGSVEARALANKLGMNTAALKGPVSQKLADLWSLHRMSESLSESIGRPVRASKSPLTEALSWGVVSGAGSVGWHAGGPVAAGAARNLARQALGTALHGAAHISAAAGRFRQSVVNGAAKVMSPVGRRAAGLGAINKVVSSTYAPNTEHTTDYNVKAQQLRWLQQNPKPVEDHLRETLKDIGAVDPAAYTATVDAGMTRLKNLAAALPNSVSISTMVKHSGPTAAQIAEWHAYEAVTADRDLIFKYLRAGVMPQGVVDAYREQHPDHLAELREYVLNNPDEVQSAPHKTQMALSKLLGVPLVPEADPAYVARMQEPYQKAKQKAAQAQQANQGASALHATPPTTVQIIQLPH